MCQSFSGSKRGFLGSREGGSRIKCGLPSLLQKHLQKSVSNLKMHQGYWEVSEVAQVFLLQPWPSEVKCPNQILCQWAENGPGTGFGAAKLLSDFF